MKDGTCIEGDENVGKNEERGDEEW